MSCYCKDLIEKGYDLEQTEQRFALTKEDGTIEMISYPVCYDI